MVWWRRASGSNARGDDVAELGLASQPLATRAAFLGWHKRRSLNARSNLGSRRQKHPLRKQQRLKRPRGAAWARVVSAELLDELLAVTNHSMSALDSRLRREALAPLARDLESTRRLRLSVSWHTSLWVEWSCCWSSGVDTIHRPSPYEGAALPLSYRTAENGPLGPSRTDMPWGSGF